MITGKQLELLIPHNCYSEEGIGTYNWIKVLDLVYLFKNKFDVNELKYSTYKTNKFTNRYLSSAFPLESKYFTRIKKCFKKALDNNKDYIFIFNLPDSYGGLTTAEIIEGMEKINNALYEYHETRIKLIKKEIERINIEYPDDKYKYMNLSELNSNLSKAQLELSFLDNE